MKIGTELYKFLVQSLSGHHLRKFKFVRNLNKQVQDKIKSDYAVVQGSKMYLGKGDHYNLSIFGIYEPKETKLVQKEIKDGDTVIDIGASIGYYTLLFSKLVGKKGKVYSFEPNTEIFEILKHNVQINGYSNVVLENKGVSNKNGESIILGKRVETVSLDEYFKIFHEKINFIKIDVEGHEKHVFEGMKALLQNNESLKIMFEYHPQILADYKSTPKELLNIVNDSGFKMFDILQDCKPVDSKNLLETYPNQNNPHTDIFCKRN